MRKEQQTLQGQMPRTEGTFTIFSKIVLSDDLDTCFMNVFVQFRYFQVEDIQVVGLRDSRSFRQLT